MAAYKSIDTKPFGGWITTGIFYPTGVAVDAYGKIYVANTNSLGPLARGSVTTYKSDGARTTPKITIGIDDPLGVAVDKNGKIYVTNDGNSTVTSYKPDGAKTAPTIATGLHQPVGIALH